MKYLVIGTAGHVDHGKTTLIKTLTGIDTDRLWEEKERGISIELGFAHLDLPDGRRAGIVDVPGHERFVKHMLAGIGGIDLVLLVIAADEGVMPQTREHLDIIQLLGIEKGIVVLNKMDLVESDWLDLVEEDVRDFLTGTVLANAPVQRVSAVTGAGLPELLATVVSLAGDIPDRSTAGPTRLPIDRVFSVTGFGTVVTGTLASGVLKTGDAVEVMPRSLTTRVRSLQTHQQKVGLAVAGQRVAVNLAGLETQALERGDVLTSAGAFRATRRLDVKLFLLANTPKPLKNRARVRFHLGAAEILSRVLLLDRDELAPGGDCYAQILLEQETVAARQDRLVIRSYSPVRTIGGGRVLDPNPLRHKRFQPAVLEKLAVLEKGTPGELVESQLRGSMTPVTVEEVAERTGLEAETVVAACRALETEALLLRQGEFLVHTANYTRWQHIVVETVHDYQRRYPLREGFPKEELRSRAFADFSGARFHEFLQALADEGRIVINSQSLALKDFVTRELPEAVRRHLEQLEEVYRIGALQPPTTAQAFAEVGMGETEGLEYLHYLIRRDVLVRVDNEWCFHTAAIQDAQARIEGYFREHGELSVAEARDLLGTSRRYTLPLLEYFDRKRITKRVGDRRVPVKK